jgi:hypothetical protein
MKDRIERSCAQPITVPAQLVDHRLAEDRPFGRVMQDVQPDQPGVEVAINHRISMSDSDGGVRSLSVIRIGCQSRECRDRW